MNARLSLTVHPHHRVVGRDSAFTDVALALQSRVTDSTPSGPRLVFRDGAVCVEGGVRDLLKLLGAAHDDLWEPLRRVSH